ncbi:MAG: hypothetical protein IPL96_17320 [Holophagaceae bacterium]|nr:hypothetical protein [Holophagaceae bacterium]
MGVGPRADDLPMLPLLIQPLVENASSTAPEPPGWPPPAGGPGGRARASASRWPTKAPPPPAGGARQGIGPEETRSRLAPAYGDTASPEVQRRDDWTTADLDLHVPTLQERHEPAECRPRNSSAPPLNVACG